MRAVLVVDMINEFVKGKFGSERARSIVPNIAALLEGARSRGWPVFYLRDSHREGDPELRVWGPHAMAGTRASEVVDELSPREGDAVIEKRWYDGFLETDLGERLRGLGVEEVVIVGISTDICVMHTAWGAFTRGLRILVPEDCTESISEENKRWALEYMKTVYGAEVVPSYRDLLRGS